MTSLIRYYFSRYFQFSDHHTFYRLKEQHDIKRKWSEPSPFFSILTEPTKDHFSSIALTFDTSFANLLKNAEEKKSSVIFPRDSKGVTKESKFLL